MHKLKAVELEYPDELLVTASEFQTREEIVLEAIRMAQRYCGCNAFSEIISIGDGYWDLLTAKKLGLTFIGISSGANRIKLEASGAINVYSDFMESEITTKWCGREDAPHI